MRGIMAQAKAHLVLESVTGDGLRFRATSDSGRPFVLDSGPGAVGPSPTEVLIASLGACTGMDVISILRKKRLVVTGYEIELVGQRRDTHPRAYTAIDIVHRLKGRELPANAIEEALRLSETKYCSVHATLAPGVAITNRYEILPENA